MTIYKARDRREEYILRSRSRDIHEMSGRTGRPDITLFVAERILGVTDPAEDAALVDVGCGDATLLMMVAESRPGTELVGLLPTAEEVARLTSHLRGSGAQGSRPISIREGTAEATGLPSGRFDTVVMSGVLPLLTDAGVAAALTEATRIIKPEGRLFLGEIPDRWEQEGRNYGDSIGRWLWWVLRRQGVAQFSRQTGRVIRARLTREPFIIAPKEHWFIDPEAFVSQVCAHGFRLEWRGRHVQPDRDGVPHESPTRWDFLFRRA